MSYEERIKKILGNNDTFWYIAIDNFIKEVYENKEEGVSALENLSKDTDKFNEFTKQIVQRRDDFKSIKEEFLIEENLNIEEIAKKIVFDIRSMGDDAETSISELVNRRLEVNVMFSLCDLVVEKLKEFGLYLNFVAYKNQTIGLPFNIAFKKGYIQNIVISKREYNGHYGKGSILEEVVEFKIDGENPQVKTLIGFCSDEKLKNKAILECSLPLYLEEQDIIKINQLINEIKSKYQPCDNKASKELMPEYLKYIDLKINGIDYVIALDDEILLELRSVIKCDFVNKALYNSYELLIKE